MRVVIIDDERLARNELKSLLNSNKQIEVVGEAKNGFEGIEEIEQKSPDLIFLDVQMPEMTGFEMLKKIDEIPHVIFTTAYDDYALSAFEANALDYLLKPIDEEKLAAAIEKAQTRIEEDNFVLESNEEKSAILRPEDHVFLKDGEKCFFPKVENIRYFESQGNYVRVFFLDNKPMILKSLNALEERLCSKTFFRANRKYIVNINYITSVENWFNGGLRVTLSPNEQIEISRRQAIKFKDLHSL